MKTMNDVSKMDARCRFASARWVAMVIAAVLALAGLGGHAAQAQSTIYVPDDHPTIQAAIDASSNGDEIVVAPGTYYEAINFNGKAVHLRSSDGPAVTIIDATGLNASVVRCVSSEGPGSILEGFTITGGTGTVVGGVVLGGGMYNFGSSPTVTNCVFQNNSAFDGGGMSNWSSSSPTVTNCVFEGNTATSTGGGMFNRFSSSPTVTGCTFIGNSASSGGGMVNANSSSPTVTNCTFTDNSAANSGGGMLNGSSSPTVTNCVFDGNLAFDRGGGMWNSDSNPTVTNCVFENNSATSNGGGMWNGLSSSPTVTNCTFENNSANLGGGGIMNYTSTPTVTGCVFENNSAASYGGGMHNHNSGPTVTDCVFVSNSANTNGGGMLNSYSTPLVTDCIFENNSANLGGGMYNGNSAPTVTNCTFKNNSAGFFGGGMHNHSSSPTIGGTLFCENVPDDIAGEGTWTDDGGNEFLESCDDPNGGGGGDGGGGGGGGGGGSDPPACTPHWDTTIGQPGIAGPVNAMISFGGSLYAAGSFGSAGNEVGTGRVARWDGSEWHSVGGGMTDGQVFDLAIFNDGTGPALYAGGSFTQTVGGPAMNIAKWNGSTWSDIGSGMSGTIFALAVFDDGNGPALYAAGGSGAAGNRIAKWDGTSWQVISGGPEVGSEFIYALAVFDDGAGQALYAGGTFANAGGHDNIAKWNGSQWSTISGGTDEAVFALAVFDGSLYVGGFFTHAGGIEVNRVARWNGAHWSPLASGVSGDSKESRVVRSLAVFDDGSGPALYVGGGFTVASGVSANNIARWDGGIWSALGLGLELPPDARVRLTASDMSDFTDGQGPALFIGGGFSHAGGSPADNIAAWRACPSPDGPANEPPTAVAGPDQSIHAGNFVFLDGSESFDDDTDSADLIYEWTMTEKPEGSAADLTLSDADTAFPFFFADLPGTYVLSLIVTDEGGLVSEPSIVTISSLNIRPVAVAGDNFGTYIGAVAFFDGINSHDPDGDAITFSWSIIEAPEGSATVLADADTDSPWFVPDVAGTYTIELVVNDGFEDSEPSQVMVSVISAEEFAAVLTVEAMNVVVDLPLAAVTTKGNQSALSNFMKQVVEALQNDDVDEAIKKLQQALERTDGCVLRGSPDGPGPGRDWITDCDVQVEMYELLTAAIDALTP